MVRIGIVDHNLNVIYESYVYVNPNNVVDWCTACKSVTYLERVFSHHPRLGPRYLGVG
jgi:hypothetical protein